MESKYFLLIAGHRYYPGGGTEDWIDTFSTEREAYTIVTHKDNTRVITKGKKKGELENTYTSYIINEREYDWYDVIDLREWINRE